MGPYAVGNHWIEPERPKFNICLADGTYIGEQPVLIDLNQQAFLLHSLQAGKEKLKTVFN